jgi:hypothetical protein
MLARSFKGRSVMEVVECACEQQTVAGTQLPYAWVLTKVVLMRVR